MERIRQVYPNTLHIKVIRPDNSGYALPDIDDIRALDPMDVFEEMYKRSRGEEMTDEQRRIVRGMMEDSGVRF